MYEKRWGKPKEAAVYAGIGLRTMRNWLKNGLKHSRLPSGKILIKFSDVDDFLEKYACTQSQIDAIVDEVCNEFL